MRIVVAPDKFRGTLSASEAAAALSAPLTAAGHVIRQIPLSDGGEGLVDALGGANRHTVVSGPLGDAVEAAWRLSGRDAVMEMSAAAGLALAGGSEFNDPLSATTAGVGQLITAAIESGATSILLGVGGSATTDGGLGALREINLGRLKGVELVVACDVRTRFSEAPATFGPQKGATPAHVKLLERRFEALRAQYLDDFGIDVEELESSGAAGGLAGGLAAVGSTLVSGFDEVADRLELFDLIEQAELVVTGEGRLDAQSFNGKVVGGVVELAAEAGVGVLVVSGVIDDDIGADLASGRFGDHLETLSLTEIVGEAAALDDAAAAIAHVLTTTTGSGLSFHLKDDMSP